MAISSLPSTSLAASLLLAGRAAAVAQLGKDVTESSTIIQLFEWPWNSIAQECTDFIGPYGYGAVQVSPASEHITGTAWWTDYQPVSYSLDVTKRGTRDEFSAMVEACHSAGVAVLVDGVLNHMTIGDTTTGMDGDTFTKYAYPKPPYTADQFHYCEGNGQAKDISDMNNSTDFWFCENGGLADLATEQDGVRSTLSAYLTDLMSNLGVDGFRFDSAACIPPADWTAILSGVSSSVAPWTTQEVIYGQSTTVTEELYAPLGHVTGFHATTDFMSAFQSTGLKNLTTPIPWGEAWGYLPSESTNPFVADHDTERGSVYGSLTAESANNAFALANVFLLGWDYGTPTVLSGYDYIQPTPQNSSGFTTAVTCFDGTWQCEHRWQSIANMVGFRNATAAANVSDIFAASDNDNQIAWGRGALGFVAINNQGSDWSNTFASQLPAGSYCDVIHGAFNTTSPCPTTITVAADGSFTATVPAYDAVALYVGSPTTTIG